MVRIIGILQMEVILSYNWNVYKVFKSGKRAKTPFCVIECESKAKAKEKFLDEHLSGKDSKLCKYIWSFVRSDLSQEREYEKNLEKELEGITRKNNFLGRLAIKAGALPNNIMAGLLFTEETNWQWQWAACEPGSMKFLKALSPSFKSAIKAEEWLTTQLKKSG